MHSFWKDETCGILCEGSRQHGCQSLSAPLTDFVLLWLKKRKAQRKRKPGFYVLCNEKWSNKITTLSILETVTPQDISCCVKQCHKILNTTSVLKINTYHLTPEGGWLESKNVTKGQKPRSPKVVKKPSSVCVTRPMLWQWINVPQDSPFVFLPSWLPSTHHGLFLNTSVLCLPSLVSCGGMETLFWPRLSSCSWFPPYPFTEPML